MRQPGVCPRRCVIRHANQRVLFLAGPPWVASLWSRENSNKVPKGRCDNFSFVPTPSGIVRHVKLRLGRCYLGKKKCAVVPYLRSAPLADLCLPSLLPNVSFVLRENTGMSCEPPGLNRANRLKVQLQAADQLATSSLEFVSIAFCSHGPSKEPELRKPMAVPDGPGRLCGHTPIEAASANLQN